MRRDRELARKINGLNADFIGWRDMKFEIEIEGVPAGFEPIAFRKAKLKEPILVAHDTILIHEQEPIPDNLVLVLRRKEPNEQDLLEIPDFLRRSEKEIIDEALMRCAADRDGDCSHPNCPQVRDEEPLSSGRHCPIDRWNDRE